MLLGKKKARNKTAKAPEKGRKEINRILNNSNMTISSNGRDPMKIALKAEEFKEFKTLPRTRNALD